jgi:ParB family chromosome partitioning protein
LTLEYVHGVARLIEKGEQRLLRSVESGAIPLSVAVDIAESPDHEVQAALSSAYEQGLLKGRKLLAAKRLIEQRRRRGKGLGGSGTHGRERPSADALVKAYREDAHRKQMMIRKTEATRNQLLLITAALRKLSEDEQFVALLEDEDLATVPEAIADRLRQQPGVTP